MKRLLLIGCLLGALPALGATSNVLKESTKPKMEIGLAVASVVPNNNPELESQFSAFGPRIHIPMDPVSIHISGLFGKQSVTDKVFTEYFSVDLGVCLTLWTPFFSGFVEGGAHYMNYRRTFSTRFSRLAAFVGTGFGFNVSKDWTIKLDMKVALHSRAIAVFAANFMAKF